MLHTFLDLAGATPVGVVIVDRAAKVAFVNKTANAILNAGLIFRVQNGVLTAADHTAKLHNFITCVDDEVSSPYPMMIPQSNALPISILVVSLLWARTIAGSQQRLVGVIISDPSVQQRTSEAALRYLYGFTQAEASVASHLMNGEALATIAVHLRMCVNTVRTHVKKLFQKTETCRQSELVRLLLTGPAPLWSELQDESTPLHPDLRHLNDLKSVAQL